MSVVVVEGGMAPCRWTMGTEREVLRETALKPLAAPRDALRKVFWLSAEAARL